MYFVELKVINRKKSPITFLIPLEAILNYFVIRSYNPF